MYSAPNVIGVGKTGMEGDGVCEKRGVYRVLLRKPEGKRPLGRSRRRWEDNIRMKAKISGMGGRVAGLSGAG